MRASQNQLERFRCIAKKLVDDHSAELFARNSNDSLGAQKMPDQVFVGHLDILGRELNEQAEMFIGSRAVVSDDIKNQIWETCKRYIESFALRNRPVHC